MYRRILNHGILLLCCTALLAGCDDGGDRANTPGEQFSYSVLSSASGSGQDLLEELNGSALPMLEKAGAQEYAIWGQAAEPTVEFEELGNDKLVLMLRWKEVKVIRLNEVLEAMSGVSDVSTSLWETSLRGDGPIETGEGFYIHRFNSVLSADAEQVLSLSERAWETWEPFWDAVTIGTWSELNAVNTSNGISRHMRIAWYRDMAHWQETRQFWLEPESLDLFIERSALQLDDAAWSASLQQP